MGLSRRQIKRLEEKGSQAPVSAMQERWALEAVRHLSDRELELLDSALERGFDPQKERQDESLSPDEWAAFERFNEFYEEARRRGG